jgi:hypothetical protein
VQPDINRANQIAAKYGFKVIKSVPGSDNVYILKSSSVSATGKRDISAINAIESVKSEPDVVDFEQERRLSFTKR